MNTRLSHWLRDNLENFDESIQIAVFSFMAYVETNGLKGLKGRNKSSAPPNPHTKKDTNTPNSPKNIVFGIIIWACRAMSSKRVGILRANIFCIIVIMMASLYWWILAPTHHLICQAWINWLMNDRL